MVLENTAHVSSLYLIAEISEISEFGDTKDYYTKGFVESKTETFPAF